MGIGYSLFRISTGLGRPYSGRDPSLGILARYRYPGTRTPDTNFSTRNSGPECTTYYYVLVRIIVAAYTQYSVHRYECPQPGLPRLSTPARRAAGCVARRSRCGLAPVQRFTLHRRAPELPTAAFCPAHAFLLHHSHEPLHAAQQQEEPPPPPPPQESQRSMPQLTVDGLSDPGWAATGIKCAFRFPLLAF